MQLAEVRAVIIPFVLNLTSLHTAEMACLLPFYKLFD